jgi:phosphomannomutase
MSKKAAESIAKSKAETAARRLFGTDGIRGTANQFPMTPDLVLKVGQAMGHILTREPGRNAAAKVVIGKDTRISGYMVELALTSGLEFDGRTCAACRSSSNARNRFFDSEYESGCGHRHFCKPQCLYG